MELTEYFNLEDIIAQLDNYVSALESTDYTIIMPNDFERYIAAITAANTYIGDNYIDYGGGKYGYQYSSNIILKN